MKYNIKYWKDYYKSGDAPLEPSQFALFCRGFMNEGQSLLDVGAGNLRDSYYFNSEGLFVTAMDVIDTLTNTGMIYIQGNLAEQKDMFGLVKTFDFVYMRFLLHALPLEIEKYVLRESYKILNRRGLLCIETRSDKGVLLDNHYRRLINMEDLLLRLSDFQLIYKVEQRGLAVRGDENPIIIRVICQR